MVLIKVFYFFLSLLTKFLFFLFPLGTNDSSTTNVNKLSKQMKLSTSETNSIQVLINAYREAASYLNRSADELEQLV
jgi:hypothetical protein